MDAHAPALGYPAPWGYVTTVGWTLLALVVGVLVAAVGYGLAFPGNLNQVIENPYDGVVVSFTVIVSSAVQVAVLAGATKLRGWPADRYLALALPRRTETLVALAMSAALILVVDITFYLIGQDLVPQFQIDSYRTAKAVGWLPFLFLAIVVFAPISEEVMFRGFVYRGFTRVAGREPYAILIIALGWTSLHIQYANANEWLSLVQVFAIGLFFGWLRWTTGSTILTILLHIFMNLEAMIETVIRVEWFNS